MSRTFFILFILISSIGVSQNDSIFHVNDIRVEGNIRTHENAIIIRSRLKIDSWISVPGKETIFAMKALWQTGDYKSIEIIRVNVPMGIELIIKVEEYFKLGSIRYLGLTKSEQRRMSEDLSIKKRICYNPQSLKVIESQLNNYLNGKGYIENKFSLDSVITNDGLVSLVYKVLKGQRFRVDNIDYLNTEYISARQFNKSLNKIRASTLLWPGSLYEDNGDCEVDNIENIAKINGYPYAEIDSLKFNLNKQRVNLSYFFNESTRYKFGEFRWEGNESIDDTVLNELAQKFKGTIYNIELINCFYVCNLFTLVNIIYALLIQGPLRRTIEEGSRLASQKYANLIESLAGLETVKLFSAQSQFQFRWEEAVAHMANWNIKSRRITDSIQNTAGFVQQSTNVGMIIFGVYLIAEGELTMGGLIAATMLSGRAIGPLVQLSLLSTRYNQAKSSMTLIEQVMSMPDEQEEGKRYIHRPIIQGHIALDKVTFHYPDSPVASIRDLTLNIKPGEKVAIIGRIGSGKTTLERLIMGLYKPTEGHVRIDDTDMEQLHHVDVRRNIGCVPQDSNLFYGSVRDNITLGRPLVDDRDVMDAANRAGVTAFTQQDPAGLERQVGEGGALLSGGQRQSIAIARAFLGRPPVLLMDEPTSAMDNRSEMHIKHQLNQLLPNETLILITHKTSMLDIVDRVIVMERGSIIADGPKAQVLSDLKQGKVRAVS